MLSPAQLCLLLVSMCLYVCVGFRGVFYQIWGGFLSCILDVSYRYPAGYMYPRRILRYPKVSWKGGQDTCILNVSHMYPACILDALTGRCILSVSCVSCMYSYVMYPKLYPTCIPDVSHMYPTCIVLVYPERILRGVCILGCVQGT